MVFRELNRKFSLLTKILEIKVSDVVREIEKTQNSTLKGRDKNTIDRRIKTADTISEYGKQELAEAFLAALKTKTGMRSELTLFQKSMIPFCQELNIDLVKAAVAIGLPVPIPDIVVQSVFNRDDDPGVCYEGSYIIFRHDKEREIPAAPYLQACAKMALSENGLLTYQDEWVARNGVRQNYLGTVFSLPRVLNIIGESRSTEFSNKPELWWCGLQGNIDTSGQAKLWGYVSDISQSGDPYTDRIVMVRTTHNEIERIVQSQEYYVPKSKVESVAGSTFSLFLEEWEDIKITLTKLSTL